MTRVTDLVFFLARCEDGVTEDMLVRHGFPVALQNRAVEMGVVRRMVTRCAPPGLRHKYPRGFDLRRLYAEDHATGRV